MLNDAYYQECGADLYSAYQELGGEKSLEDFERCVNDFIEIVNLTFVGGEPGESKYTKQIIEDSLRDKVSYREPAYKYWALEVGCPEEAERIFDAVCETIELS